MTIKTFNMRIKYLTLLAALIFAGTTAFAQKTLPDVNVRALDGQMVNLSEAYGGENDEITIFSFWATWCSPCKRELDAIADYYEDWQEEYNVELVAITIDTRRGLAQVGPMVEAKGWDYTILSGNDQDMRNAFNFSTIPQTIVVDQKGNIVYTHNGYTPGDEDELEDVIAKLAGK